MKVLIEMNVPDNLGPSALLDIAQQLAVDLAEDYPDEGEELDEDAKEAIRNDVSVTEVPGDLAKSVASFEANTPVE